jgi:hypothetical protein
MARHTGRIAAVIVAISFAHAAPTLAGSAVSPVRIVAAVPATSGSARDVTFVGGAGQLYAPAPGSVWKREALGGVAVAVKAAFRGRKGSIYVSGKLAPVYRWTAGGWQLRPLPNRGRIVPGGATGAPSLAIERHVYVQTASKWARLGSHTQPITALWASDPKRVYAADATGGLTRSAGAKFTPLRVALSPGDAIATLSGRPGKDLYALSTSGVVLAVTGNRATAVATVEFGAQAVAIGASKAGVFAVMSPPAPPATAAAPDPGAPPAAPTPPAAASYALVRIDGKSVARLDELPALPAADRWATVTADDAGWIVAASRAGSVAMRAPDGAWTLGRVSGELPAGATRSFDGSRPAPSP